MRIIARKPRPSMEDVDGEYIVVARDSGYHPFVVATATPHSLSYGEWFWGHYFASREEALKIFDGLTT